MDSEHGQQGPPADPWQPRPAEPAPPPEDDDEPTSRYGQFRPPPEHAPYQPPGQQQPSYQQPSDEQPSDQPTAYQPYEPPPSFRSPYQQQPYQQSPYQQSPYQQPPYQQQPYQQSPYEQHGYDYQQPAPTAYLPQVPPGGGYPPPSQYGQQYGQQQYGQAPYSPYGQQQYGAYAYPTQEEHRRGKRKAPLWVGLGVLAAVIVAAVIVLFVAPGVLATKKLSHSAVEKTIKQQSQQFGGYNNVTCNGGKDVPLKKGKTFTCTADGKTINVVITSTSGDYTWQPAG